MPPQGVVLHATPPDYFHERRRRASRVHLFAAVPPQGTRTGGATAVLQIPMLILTTGAGPDRVMQVIEQFGGELDPWNHDSVTLYWDHEIYFSCIMGSPVAVPAVNPTATQYAGCSFGWNNVLMPLAVSPASVGEQGMYIRTRRDTGEWSVVQDNAIVSQTDVLTGVQAFDANDCGFLVEAHYVPSRRLAVWINGALGIDLTGASMILQPGVAIPHGGAGVFVTSGTHAAGNGLCRFTQMRIDVIA